MSVRGWSMGIGGALLLMLTTEVVSKAQTMPVQQWIEADGTETVLVEDHRLPLVELRVRFPGGTWSPWGHKGHASVAFVLQSKGRENALAAEARRYGLGWAVRIYTMESELLVRCLRENLPQAVQFVQHMLQNTEWDDTEWKQYKLTQSWNWNTQKQDPAFRWLQTVAQAFYQPADSRRMEWEPPLSLPRSWSSLVPMRDTQVRLPGRRVGWAGDIDPATASRATRGLLPPALLESPRDLVPQYFPQTPPAVDQTSTVERTQQAYVGYARPGLSVSDPAFPAFLLAHHVWTGHFYSRLYMALRGEQGSTYEIRSRLGWTKQADLYQVFTYTRADKVALLENKIRAGLQLFAQQGIASDEFVEAQSYWQHRPAFEEQTPFQTLATALSERARDLPLGFDASLKARIQTLKREEVNKFIRAFYDPAQVRFFRVVSN